MVLAVVVALELVTGANAVLLTLVVIAPSLASSWLSRRATLGHAVASVGIGAALGACSGQYGAGHVSDQLVRIAAVAQHAILPPVSQRLEPLHLAASCDSAEEEADIGGDLYTAVRTPFGVRLLLADARGHGPDAVNLAVSVPGSSRERAPEREHLSALIAEVCNGVPHAVNAGHAPPLLLRAGVAMAIAPAWPSVHWPRPPVRMVIAAVPVPAGELTCRRRELPV